MRIRSYLKRPAAHLVVAALIAIALCLWAYFTLQPAERNFERVGRIIELGILGLGLASIILLFHQNQQFKNWNKLLSYHEHFGSLITLETLGRVQSAADACGFAAQIDSDVAILPASLDMLMLPENRTHRLAVSAYLDEFEEFCGAVQAGIVHDDYAYKLEATRVMRAWRVYEPYISRTRSRIPGSKFYLELENVARRWRDRRSAESAKANDSAGVVNHV